MAGEDVTMKQEIFCQSWVDTVGNGTRSALVAFDIENKELLEEEEPTKPLNKDLIPSWEIELKELRLKKNKVISVAASMATEYLRKPDVIKRIDAILEERGFNDDAVKREHFKLITNSKDEVRMRAIDSYYKLKGKIIDKLDSKVAMTVNIDSDVANKYDINSSTEDNS